MYYVEKIVNLQNHVKDNPKDYQAVIALLIARSDQIAYERRHKMNMRIKKVAEYRRKPNEQKSDGE